MSPLYEQAVKDLTAWYAERLPALGKVVITREQYGRGVDCLQPVHRELSKQAFTVFKTDRHYELSYNQDCIAFFNAAKQCGVLEVI